MSSSEDTMQRAVGTTEIILVTGESHHVEGNLRDVERTIVDAARGSIMQLAWLIEADTRDAIGVNPEHVVLMRGARAAAT